MENPHVDAIFGMHLIPDENRSRHGGVLRGPADHFRRFV